MVDRDTARTFEDADVVDCYRFRPDYPAALIDWLIAICPKRSRALDLGCGPGKLAHRLATAFGQVDAVDPSPAMLAIADYGRHDNIAWIEATAENAPLEPPYDLIVAGASVHWMDHEIIFPRLGRALAPGGWIAIVDGDAPTDPPWGEVWVAFLTRWIRRMGGVYDPDGYRAKMNAYHAWLDIHGTQTFSQIVEQPVDDFIACQHSRATWARNRMGPKLSQQFDTELRDLLSNHSCDDQLCYQVETTVTVGRVHDNRAARSQRC